MYKVSTLPFLPYLRRGPARRWGRIISTQFTSPNVTIRLQEMVMKPRMAVKL